jgi:hypothetical protein
MTSSHLTLTECDQFAGAPASWDCLCIKLAAIGVEACLVRLNVSCCFEAWIEREAPLLRGIYRNALNIFGGGPPRRSCPAARTVKTQGTQEAPFRLQASIKWEPKHYAVSKRLHGRRKNCKNSDLRKPDIPTECRVGATQEARLLTNVKVSGAFQRWIQPNKT